VLYCMTIPASQLLVLIVCFTVVCPTCAAVGPGAISTVPIVLQPLSTPKLIFQAPVVLVDPSLGSTTPPIVWDDDADASSVPLAATVVDPDAIPVPLAAAVTESVAAVDSDASSVPLAVAVVDSDSSSVSLAAAAVDSDASSVPLAAAAVDSDASSVPLAAVVVDSDASSAPLAAVEVNPDLSSTAAVDSVSNSPPPVSTCGDSVINSPEECDDGNTYNADGCDKDCRLESSDLWFCTTDVTGKTNCCPPLTNPLDRSTVCSCADIVQPSEDNGYTVTPMCRMRDIDECNTDNGRCLPLSICQNYDVVLDPESPTHACDCPPGQLGDGMISCEDDPDFE
jgi:cysteine-rich repeat protein